MKSKKILSILLATLLTTLTFSMLPIVSAGASITVNITLPGGWSDPIPPYFWYWDPTIPGWTTATWNSSIPTFGVANTVAIKVPAVITAENPGEQRKYLIAAYYNHCPECIVLAGPIAEGVYMGSPPVPTLYYLLQGDCWFDQEYRRAGPVIDKLRAKVIKNPDAQLLAMQMEEGVALTDLIRVGDIEKLDDDGFTITDAPGFHMGHIGYNIRPDRDYLTPPYKCNPAAAPVLSDVNFRHACFHLYNQEEIVSSIYGYTVTAVQSLVPPSQGGWVNPDVPTHPYNPGDPLDDTIYDPETGEYADACSILRYGGYTYSAARNNWITPYDIDGDDTAGETNGDDDIPTITLWTPTYEVAPTSAEHGSRFCADAREVGVSLEYEPREFDPYMDDVEIGDFDMYMVFWSLGRFPDHLYTMCHSDHDVAKVPGDYNFPGCHDPELDEAVLTIWTSLDHDEKMAACYKAQEILYSEEYPDAAFSYMQLYSRIYFNGFNPDLEGIVNSPGYGSANGWTYTNMRWAEGEEVYEDGETIIEWIWGEEPELLNPCSASTVYAWDIIEKTLDGLIAVNPYTHEDLPWMAKDWEIQKWATEDDVDELLTNIVTVTNESLGFGDGSKTVFNLENCHVIPASETVYLNNTAQTIVIDYTIDYTDGEINFTTAPSATTWINADYMYNYLVGADCVGSHWHEDWPQWSTNWYMQDWTDIVPVGFGANDIVEFKDNNYTILDMTWDIKVESKEEPYGEMKLSGLDPTLNRPPDPINKTDMIGTWWHEEWPIRSQIWVVTAVDDPHKNLTRSQQIWLNGTEYHVDSVTVTLHLDKLPGDATIDKVVEFAGTGMKVLFWLREDVFWQDGKPYVAGDAVFNWLFLRDNQIPRYRGTWQFIEDAVAVTDYKVVAYMNTTSQFLIYDLAGEAALLPPPVWEPLDGEPLTTIMQYDPTAHNEKLAGMGEWFNPTAGVGNDPGFPETHLYGTGVFVFEYYNDLTLVSDLHQCVTYFKSAEEISDQKTEMFHMIGDVNRDGWIWGVDKTRYSKAFATKVGEDDYDEDCDISGPEGVPDGWVNIFDGVRISFFWGDKKEYP